MVDLPIARADVVGILPGDPPLSVLSSLGAGGDHVLVVVSDDVRYGLHVLEVLGVVAFDDDRSARRRRDKQGGLIAGTVYGADELVLVADAQALAARL